MMEGFPNGVVVGGPGGVPVLFDVDDKGKPDVSSGKTMPMQGWLLAYGDRMPDDAMVLVECVMSSDGRVLTKPLDSGLLRDGRRKVPVAEMAVKGELWLAMEKFWGEYMERRFS